MLLLLLLLVAATMVTTSRARPMVEDSGDYSDDFSLGANSPPAEGDERAPASAAASAAAATLAASAAAARQGDMRASEVGFAGVRFGGGEEEEDETGALVVAEIGRASCRERV